MIMHSDANDVTLCFLVLIDEKIVSDYIIKMRISQILI